jgi:hydroxymethylbilane synthase
MMPRALRIGTRGSALARIQAGWVAERLAEHAIPSELVVIRTDGDDRASDTAWGEGAFVARIEEALLQGRVDVAVHSAKDVPTDERPDLAIAAYPAREDARDALVCRVPGTTLSDLPVGARVGTDSPRRSAFLLAARPDLQVHPLFGNVDTRLAKLDRGESDALILAVAGLARLGRGDRIDQILPVNVIAPAPGQGSLAVQVRATDEQARRAVSLIDDPATRSAVVAERCLLNATGGGCRSPIGAFARADAGTLSLLAAAERTFSPEPGAAIALSRVIWARGSGALDAPFALAVQLAAHIVAARARPRVLVARASDQAAPLLDVLEEVGLGAVSVPAIEIEPVEPGGPLDQALVAARPGTWLLITSSNAATATLAGLSRAGVAVNTFRWAAVGPATAALLRARKIPDPFVPRAATGMALADELPLDADDEVLLPRTDVADDALPTALRARGAVVTELIAYRTIEAPTASRSILGQAFDDGPVDAIVLTSGSTARGLLALADDGVADRLRRTPVVAIGEPTAAAARGLGYDAVHVSSSPSIAALARFTAVSLGVEAAQPAAGAIA